LSLLLTLIVWSCFSWPLPKYVFTGIPCGAENVEVGAARAMIQGDHLQFLYYLWLGGNMITGGTRPLHDLYHFNVGNDEDRFQIRGFYFPFSLVFSLLAPLTGYALAYNMTGIISLWLTCMGTWLLIRRYVSNEVVAASSALIGILLPFRWMVLLGGSPAGLAMAWVPWMFLGLDMAVREARPGGGILAGAAILMLYCSDVQVYFFSMLLCPAWCLVALVMAREFDMRRLSGYLQRSAALLPTAVCAAITVWLAHARKATVLGGSTMEGGRTWHEVALCSPRDWRALFTWWTEPGPEHTVFVGVVLPCIIAVGTAAAIVGWLKRRRGNGRRDATVIVLTIVASGCVSVALGTSGPFDGLPLRICRRIVPFFAMARQTTKIFAVMPPLLAVLTGVSIAAMLRRVDRPKRAGLSIFAVVAVLLMAGEHSRRLHATVSVLDRGHPVYERIAGDAGERGVRPHILAVPLWPGDTAWSSIYLHYVFSYRIRMVNGYSPVVPARYVDDIFMPFQGVNQGTFAEGQLDDLQARGVDYVVLHERAFPDKVSPLAVGHTLRNLLEHPRLKLLERDKGVWGFRIEGGDDGERGRVLPECAFFAPTRLWEAELNRQHGTTRVQDPEAGREECVQMSEPGAWIETSRPNPPRTPYLPDMRWLVRAKGSGLLEVDLLVSGSTNRTEQIGATTEDWQWFELPIPAYDGLARPGLRLRLDSGVVYVDGMLVVAGELPTGDTIRIPAATLIHEAETDIERHAIRLAADRVKHDPVRGPNIPVPPGRYTVEFLYSSEAAEDTHLGSWYVRTAQGAQPVASMTAGQPAAGTLEQRSDLPLDLRFMFSRRADLTLEAVVLRRVRVDVERGM